MSKRFSAWKRQLAALSLGGATFAFFGLGNANCVSNEGLTDFYTAVGQASIHTFVDPAAAIGSDFNDIILVPTTAFLDSAWAGYVASEIPQDPTLSLLRQ